MLGGRTLTTASTSSYHRANELVPYNTYIVKEVWFDEYNATKHTLPLSLFNIPSFYPVISEVGLTGPVYKIAWSIMRYSEKYAELSHVRCLPCFQNKSICTSIFVTHLQLCTVQVAWLRWRDTKTSPFVTR